MLAGEKICLYLDRIKTLVDEIETFREEAEKEHRRCIDEESIDEETYAPSDLLKKQIATLYGMMKVKEELSKRVQDFITLMKRDPQRDEKDIDEICTILEGFRWESEQDKLVIENLSAMGTFKGELKVSIMDGQGEVLEEIVIDGDEDN